MTRGMNVAKIIRIAMIESERNKNKRLKDRIIQDLE